MGDALSLNMRLLAHHELQGFGGMGEGMGMQLAGGGRRILWLAHESAPKNFTGVDVTNPRAPRVVVQTELPHTSLRSNSLDVVGDTLAVAYFHQLRLSTRHKRYCAPLRRGHGAE